MRYVSADGGVIKYGEPILADPKADIAQLAERGALSVEVLEGSDIFSAKSTNKKDVVKRLLGPLEPLDVPIVRCIGLNYKTHSKSTIPLSAIQASYIRSD